MSALACWKSKLLPRSAGVHGTLVAVSYPLAANVLLSTYWKMQVVSKPAGTIVACSVADVGPVPSSDSAVMNGGPGGGGPQIGTVLLPPSATYTGAGGADCGARAHLFTGGAEVGQPRPGPVHAQG